MSDVKLCNQCGHRAAWRRVGFGKAQCDAHPLHTHADARALCAGEEWIADPGEPDVLGTYPIHRRKRIK